MNEDTRLVRPDGLSIRGLRHERGWSPRDLAAAIATAEYRATGRPAAIAPRVLLGVEERNAPIPYATLCLIAAGFDCNPIEILLEDPPESEPPRRGSVASRPSKRAGMRPHVSHPQSMRSRLPPPPPARRAVLPAR